MRMTVPMLVAALLLLVACSSSGEELQTSDATDAAVADRAAPVDAAPEASAPPVDWDAFFAGPDLPDDGKRRVVLLHTNDLHSYLNGMGPLADFTPDQLDQDGTHGGIARIAAMIEREQRSLRPGAAIVALDGGDSTFGTAFASLATAHATEFKALADAGYLATTLGNHELDWGAERLAQIISKGIDLAGDFRIVASNILFSAEAGEDDALAALVGKQIVTKRVVELPNGLRLGIFGLIGAGAFKLSPAAAPLDIEPPVATAQKMVQELREVDRADLVVCLSHSGVGEEGKSGEDEALAKAVEGIDVIVGGHSHTLLPAPLMVNGTAILQAGNYGGHLGHLVLVEGEEGFQVESWQALPVDDAVPGLPRLNTLIAAWEKLLDDGPFADLAAGYLSPIATTAQDLLPVEMGESGLANLVTDGQRWAAGQKVGPVAVAIDANGTIRAGLATGKSGQITAGDAFNVSPLHVGPDGAVGVPLLHFYLTPNELRLAAEVTVGIATELSDSFFVQFSGMKVHYDPQGKLFQKVTAIFLGSEVDGYSAQPLDLSPGNQQLVHTVASLYLGEMLAVLKQLTGGMLAIEPKHADGKVAATLEELLIDCDDQTTGNQELKSWRALIDFLRSFPPAAEGALPAIPERYFTPAGRFVAAPK